MEKEILRDREVFSAHPSLREFWFFAKDLPLFPEVGKIPLTLLELGCGNGSLFEGLPPIEARNMVISALDVSPNAIEFCQKEGKRGIHYFQDDIRFLNYPQGFDLILDAHCLHCLRNEGEVKLALGNIYRYLNPGGLCLIETMVTHDDFFPEEEADYDESTGCYSVRKRPTRFIKDSGWWEKIIPWLGLEIVYLKIEDKKMIPFPGRESSLVWDPDVMRILFRKKS